jgi:hypothetical protein
MNLISGLVRDPHKVKANLRELEDGRLVTVKGCKIYCPVRFSECNLASIGAETYICGVYAMVYDGAYAVSTVNAMEHITPSFTNKVVIGGDEYFEFEFTPGSTVIATLDLVKNKNLVYYIYAEIISKARVPWYLSYDDLAHIFDTAFEHAGANIGQQHEVTELLVSIISRNPNNRVEYYRQAVKSLEDLSAVKPDYISLKSVAYSATNTLNKLAGSYMGDGVVSALVSPSERVERIEKLLRA